MKNETTVGNSTDSFEVRYQSKAVSVQVVYLSRQTLFEVSMENLEPFIIHRSKDYAGKKTWSSLPEGNEGLAEQFGPLIEKYLKAKSKST